MEQCEGCRNYSENLPDGTFEGLTGEQVLDYLIGLCKGCAGEVEEIRLG